MFEAHILKNLEDHLGKEVAAELGKLHDAVFGDGDGKPEPEAEPATEAPA